MRDKERDFVCLDGAFLKEEQVLQLALNAGSYAQAEHYLFALLAYGVAYGKRDVLDKVNEVRAHYGVMPLKTVEQDNCDLGYKNMYSGLRMRYRRMTKAERESLMTDCLGLLRVNNERLFRFKNHWVGIYWVVRDQLDYRLQQCDFMELAQHAMPKDWPEQLAISESVFKNMKRDFHIDDSDKAYYEMRNNPLGSLCDAFWEILKQQLLSMGNEGEGL